MSCSTMCVICKGNSFRLETFETWSRRLIQSGELHTDANSNYLHGFI